MPKAENPRESGRETTPKRFAETTPPVYPSLDYSFVLQGVFDIQKNIGKLEQAVQNLTDQQKEHSKKLDALSHKIYAAIAVILFVGAVLTFFSKFTNDWLFHSLSK
jgi:hypothetical protein